MLDKNQSEPQTSLSLPLQQFMHTFENEQYRMMHVTDTFREIRSISIAICEYLIG